MRITRHMKLLRAIMRTGRAQRARRLKALALRDTRDAIACGLDDARDWNVIRDTISMAADEHAADAHEWQAVEDYRELVALRELNERALWDEIDRARDEETFSRFNRGFVS